jgi:tripartite-type tricarboxylate transporter receptor subunit TctC
MLRDLPTLSESGLKGYEADTWYGLFAPAGTPPAVLAKLNEATRTALKSPELTERFKTIGGEARPTTQEEAKAFVDDEIQRFTNLIRKLGIKLEN